MNLPTFVLGYTAGLQPGNSQTMKVTYIAYDINLRVTRTFNGPLGGTRSISGTVLVELERLDHADHVFS
jgi:hypothetical protein